MAAMKLEAVVHRANQSRHMRCTSDRVAGNAGWCICSGSSMQLTAYAEHGHILILSSFAHCIHKGTWAMGWV